MIWVLNLLTELRARLMLWGGLILILLVALRVAIRHARHAAEAEFAIRSADARIRALRTSREVSHELETLPDDERDRRLDRWMRD